MRKLFTTENIDTLRSFTILLNDKKISYFEEVLTETDWSKDSYGNKSYSLWIHDEDGFTQAEELYNEFLKTPKTVPEPMHLFKDPGRHFIERKLKTRLEPEKTIKGVTFTISYCIVLLCSFLLFLSTFSSPKEEKMAEGIHAYQLVTSPVEKLLLYDYPEKYELADKIITVYGYDALLHPQELPKAGKFLYTTYQETLTWEGYYSKLITGQPKEEKEPPQFEKIKQGQLWRLVSPAFLHNDILHLFFNMAWLFFLGIQIERHVGKTRFLIFVLASAAISNTAQYLMSGPAFIGFSGVVCAFIFFIRTRQSIAPWEGYLLSKMTFQFLFFFVFILVLFSTGAFVLEFLQLGSPPILFANTGHVSGAITGFILGKTNFFSWRTSK